MGIICAIAGSHCNTYYCAFGLFSAQCTGHSSLALIWIWLAGVHKRAGEQDLLPGEGEQAAQESQGVYLVAIHVDNHEVTMTRNVY